MELDYYFCKSTATGKQVQAKNHKDAAEKFVNEILMNCYKFKLKKVNERGAKEAPDYTVEINKLGETKKVFFQYVNMKLKK